MAQPVARFGRALKTLAHMAVSPLLRHIPRDKKWLYPFFLAGNVVSIVEEREVPGLPGALDGLSVAYASDIHFGPYFNEQQADGLVARLAAFHSDLIVLGGDYGDYNNNAVAFFNSIKPFPKDRPVLAVLGNHDHGMASEPMEPLLQAMREKNVFPLVNEAYLFVKSGASVAVLGPDDVKAGKPDYALLAGKARGADFVVFAPHSPDALPDAEEAGLKYDLALCGHTHGGQITLFGRSLHSSSQYGDMFRCGWYERADARVMVSCGVGTSILPMRWGTNAQIHCLTLRVPAKG